MFDIPCVILAGGKSSRMKEDKCFLSFKNKTLIQYQYDRLKKFFPDIYISSKTNKFPFDCNLILENEDIFSPLIALNKILNSIKKNKVFIITVDTPNVSIQSIQTIINKSEKFDISIALTPDNKRHNLCGVFSKNIKTEIKTMLNDNNHRIGFLIKKSNSQNIFINNNDEFININTKEDYKIISQ